jgi:GNAT superfamily N-acetyltransferase
MVSTRTARAGGAAGAGGGGGTPCWGCVDQTGVEVVNERGILRQARRGDIAALQRVRASVHENRLVTRRISDDEVQRYLEVLGRGWVVEVDDEVVAFAIGDATIGHLWALFVDPRHERRGYGRRLHDAAVQWLWSQGLEHLWLATEPGTRAERFYRAAGWRHAGVTPHGEMAFVLDRPQAGAGNHQPG